jgi:hypothetical protein
MIYNAANAGMECRFAGCSDGKKIQLIDTLFILKQSVNFGNYLFSWNMLTPFTG